MENSDTRTTMIDTTRPNAMPESLITLAITAQTLILRLQPAN